MQGPIGGGEVYKARRKKLLEKLNGGVAILFSHPEQIRNNDVRHSYRQDSSFYYLTGFPEAHCALVLDSSSPQPFNLFVLPKDPTKELWEGFHYGLEGAQQFFGADKVYSIADLPKVLPELLKNADTLYYGLGQFAEDDRTVLESAKTARQSRGRTGLGFPTIFDVKEIVGDLRLIKGSDEIEHLRRAGLVSAEGHKAAMRACRPGIFEYEIEAELLYVFKKMGSKRLGYDCIVGSGSNATVLHYHANDARCEDGHLLLIDAGAEINHYSGDITRTFPVNGKFTASQKTIYNGVLAVQKNLITQVKPGSSLEAIHTSCVEQMTDCMIELGLLKGKRKELIEKLEYKKYFPHGTGHWLGMDVHDSGLYRKNSKARTLERGMCFTIEPGIYVPANDTSAPAEFRGIGIRIEDDVVVTESGVEVLTTQVPKEIDEMESLIGKR